jgi:hypothetical protein
VLGDAIAETAHDVVAEGPEACCSLACRIYGRNGRRGEGSLTKAEAKTTHRLDPDRSVSLGGSLAGVPGHVLGRERTNSIRDIVGAVGDRHDLVGLLAGV